MFTIISYIYISRLPVYGLSDFYTPVFRRDVLWYGDVCPGLCPSVRLSVTFSALFSYMLWHIELKCCIRLGFTVLQIKFECHQFSSILELRILEYTVFRTFFYMLWHTKLKFCIWLSLNEFQINLECHQFSTILQEVCPFWNLEYWKYMHTIFRTFSYVFYVFSWYSVNNFRSSSSVIIFQLLVMPFLALRILEIQFSAFSPTCFDILSWNSVNDYHLMNFRLKSSVINFRLFLSELCRLWNVDYWKFSFQHDLTYWAEIWYLTFFLWISVQVIVITWGKVLRSYAPFGCTDLHTFLVHALRLSFSF